MDIGYTTACFLKICETEQALTVNAEVSEVYLKTFYEYRPEFAKKHAPQNGGVKFVRVAPCNFEPQLLAPQRRVRGDGFYWLDQILRSAQLFGAKNYTFRGLDNGSGNGCGFDDWGAYMREITEFCARYGINFAIQNGGLYDRPFVFKELRARCPNLSGALDFGAARKSGYPYQMYLNDMSGAISHIYISDADENGVSCLPGEGVLDFKEIFKTLKGEGFDGSVLIDTRNFETTQELLSSIQFLKSI